MSKRVRLWGVFGLVALVGCLAAGAWQVGRVEDALIHSGGRALARALGTEVAIGGVAEAHMLPRPYLVLSDVHIQDASGSATLDIPRIEAAQSFLSLLLGRIGFSQLRLVEPTASFDADRLAGDLRKPAMNLLGRSFPGRIVVTSAVVALRSSRPALRGLMTGLNAVIEGLDRNGAATFNGHGTWRGQRLDVAARLEPFFDFVLGRPTTGSVKLHLPALNASVEGELHAGLHGGFEGQVAAATPSLETLLMSNGLPAGVGKVAQRVVFSGSGVANEDNITFSNARLALDDTDFEGSLAWQPNEDHGAWTGTFATDTLDLTKAAALLPQVRNGAGRWSDVPWQIDRSLLGDVDLRVSSNHARIGPFVVEDAAFSALCRDGRVEASLSEARSLDGLIRGRAVASLDPHGVDLKVDVSMSQMDLDSLSQVIGRAQLTGSASGHLVMQAHGANPRAMMASLSGRGQVSIRQGSLPTLGSVADTTALGARAADSVGAWHGRSFDLVTADVDVAGDRIDVVNGRLIGPGAQRTFRADASLLDRSFSVAAADDAAPAPPIASDLVGTWDRALRVTGAGTERRPVATGPASR